MGNFTKKLIYATLAVGFAAVSTAAPAHAGIWDELFGTNIQNDLSDISQHIVLSIEDLPGFISAAAYLLGMLFGITGILKLKEHVENPGNVPIRSALARFLIGGALFALPIIFEAMATTIQGEDPVEFDPYTLNIAQDFSALNGLMGQILGAVGINEDLNYIMASILGSVRYVPALITGVAYLLAVMFTVIGLLKLKEYIEDPDRNPLKEAIIRFLIGGALFGLPTLYTAMQTTIHG